MKNTIGVLHVVSGPPPARIRTKLSFSFVKIDKKELTGIGQTQTKLVSLALPLQVKFVSVAVEVLSKQANLWFESHHQL